MRCSNARTIIWLPLILLLGAKHLEALLGTSDPRPTAWDNLVQLVAYHARAGSGTAGSRAKDLGTARSQKALIRMLASQTQFRSFAACSPRSTFGHSFMFAAKELLSSACRLPPGCLKSIKRPEAGSLLEITKGKDS